MASFCQSRSTPQGIVLVILDKDLDPTPESDLTLTTSGFVMEAKERLSDLLIEHSGTFMIHKADLGISSILKRGMDLVPNFDPRRKGAQRLTRNKSEEANQEVGFLLAAGMFAQFYSPWSGGVGLAKKKGEVSYCCL